MKKLIIEIFSLLLIVLIFQGCDTGDEEYITPTQMEFLEYVGGVVTPGDARNVFVRRIGGNDFAFVADGPEGLQIVNTGNPHNPFIVSSLSSIGYCHDVTVTSIKGAEYAFLASSASGLSIVNVTNPSSPALTAVVSLTNDAVISVAVDSAAKRVYAGTYDGFVYIINVAVLPSQPVILGSYNAYDKVKGLAVSGIHCYLAEPGFGIEIINVQNPVNPHSVSFFDTPGDPQDIAVSRQYNMAYIADGAAGLTVLDVTNPASPYFCTTKYSNDDVLGVSFNRDYVFTAELSQGCESFGIFHNPAVPQYLSYFITDGYAYGVFAGKDDLVYIADGFNGLEILSVY
jgi:hypothetical protein